MLVPKKPLTLYNLAAVVDVGILTANESAGLRRKFAAPAVKPELEVLNLNILISHTYLGESSRILSATARRYL